MWTASNQVKLGVLTAIVSVGTLVYSQRSNLNREIEARHFLQKSKIYEEIIDTLGSLFKESKGWAESEGGDILARKLFDIQSKLLVWAGPDVLHAWEGIKTGPSDSSNIGEMFTRVEQLLRALRKELGHSNDDQIGPMGLVKIYVRHEDHGDIPNG